MLLKGNCLETLKTLDTASVDSIVTDPPYELGFMGKSWDNSGIAYSQDLWAECLRVLKPGGHLLAFSGSRTYHRMVVAIEDSGFEIRDQIMWLYGSGFPKSLDVSKAIDKAAGAEREAGTPGRYSARRPQERVETNTGAFNGTMGATGSALVTAPATPEAQQWQGWGTALKPAHEPIVVARKPLIGTVANNVLTYGTGALNIDGSRVGTETVVTTNGKGFNGSFEGGTNNNGGAEREGRWPANVIHDGSDEVLAGFPMTTTWKAKNPKSYNTDSIFGAGGVNFGDADSGSAARFFYCAKASKSERNAGLEGLPEKAVGALNMRTDAHSVKNGMDTKPAQNFHPTVKPLALMRYLIKLVTPPGGVVLDPFLGSGTTAVAATLEGFDWIGCEMTEDYWPIIEARVEWAQNERTTTLF
jgi:site-specific DNA-methyltransferase (adenine-specific)